MPSLLNLFRTKKPTQKRQFEGASRSKRLSRWWAPNSSMDTETARDLPTLRARCRDLRRNNAYANRAIAVIGSNVVGAGIKTQFRPASDTQMSLDPRLELKWREWAESKAFDFDGRFNIYAMQRLIMEAVAESGEVLVRKKFNSKSKFPLQYQILEADFIDTSQDAMVLKNGHTVIQGVEFDKEGRRAALYLFEEHPGSYTGNSFKGSSISSTRVPISEIYQVFKTLRPGQSRGVPWLAPVMVRLKDVDEYEDAQLYKQKIASCFVGFVRDLSADFKDEDESCGEDLSARLEPGLLEELPPGKTIEFAQPPTVENYKEYTTTVLHAVSAGVGITFESLTGDLSQVNFSSARMGWIEMHRNIQMWRREIMAGQFLDHVVEDFLNVCAVLGFKTDGVRHVHTPPRREMIDPVKETAAIKDMIRAGLSTPSEEIMAQGKDPEDHFTQLQKDFQKFDELGLVLDCDPRKTAGGGKQQDSGASDADEGDDSEKQ